ncbi:ATP/GTP-binding protein [Dactylosporangium sp. NPDC051485]|uniref:GTP-binding protein n=1 Tax=Dactylosporangium sp. NPDC051485 TaxID=3154846 RepID=UPI00343F1220
MDRAGQPATGRRVTSVKIVIAGGFGVGKTTLVATISEITPLTTEALLTSASVGVDDTSAVPAKETTTVAMDFGRLNLDPELILYLFGTPGQDRFSFMWDELVRGAIGAVVLIDPARIVDCFAAVDYFEQRRVPYVVAVNSFDHGRVYTDAQLRASLQIRDDIPVQRIDARRRGDVRDVLTLLVQHALSTRRTTASVMSRP